MKRRPAHLDFARVALTIGSLVVLIAGCVGGPKTPTVDILEPIPPGVTIAASSTSPCKDNEAGFNYRFVIMSPGGLSNESPLLELFRQRGFYQTLMSSDDLPWARVGFQHEDTPVRIEAGPLDRYLADPRPNYGPQPDSLDQFVRDHPERYVLVALRPTDFACNTPP